MTKETTSKLVNHSSKDYKDTTYLVRVGLFPGIGGELKVSRIYFSDGRVTYYSTSP